MLQNKVLELIAKDKTAETLDLLIDFFKGNNDSLVKQFVQLKARFTEVRREKHNFLIDGSEFRLVNNRIRDAILNLLPPDKEIFKVDEVLFEKLNDNKNLCINTDTYFYTTFTLMALLQVKDGKIYQSIEAYKYNSFQHFYRVIKKYIEEKIISNPNRKKFTDFTWYQKPEFIYSVSMCIDEKVTVIDDKKLFMGIIKGNSTTKKIIQKAFNIEKLVELIMANDSFNTP